MLWGLPDAVVARPCNEVAPCWWQWETLELYRGCSTASSSRSLCSGCKLCLLFYHQLALLADGAVSGMLHSICSKHIYLCDNIVTETCCPASSFQPLSAALSGRILKEARAQQEELDLENLEEQHGQAAAQIQAGALAAAMQQLADSDSDDEDGGGRLSDAGDGWWEADQADLEVSPQEEAALAAFMSPAGADGQQQQQRSLADMIMGKIREQQQQRGISVLPE